MYKNNKLIKFLYREKYWKASQIRELVEFRFYSLEWEVPGMNFKKHTKEMWCVVEKTYQEQQTSNNLIFSK